MDLKASKSNKEIKSKNILDTISHAEAEYKFSIWVGAVVYYLLCFGAIPFSEQHSSGNLRRNLWTGYVLKILLVASFILVMMLIYAD